MHARRSRVWYAMTRRRGPGVWMFLAFVLAAVLAGCGGERMEEGVVAVVNGRTLYYQQLEAKYDLQHMAWATGATPTVAGLKEDYGEVLSDMIVLELVKQGLEEKDIKITAADVKIAEDAVRQDYPEGAFENILVEEYIDIELWRQELRDRLALETFMEQVIRPTVQLGYQEAEAYYKKNISEFFLPSRLRFVLITSPTKDGLVRALDYYKEHAETDALIEQFSQVQARELTIREDALPLNWVEPLAGVQPGEATEPQPSQNGFEALVLLERLDARVVSPSSAYPLVEKVLLEQKMEEGFKTWLENRLASSDIRVNRHLLAATVDSVTDEALEEDDALGLPDDQAPLMGETAGEASPAVVEPLHELEPAAQD